MRLSPSFMKSVTPLFLTNSSKFNITNKPSRTTGRETNSMKLYVAKFKITTGWSFNCQSRVHCSFKSITTYKNGKSGNLNHFLKNCYKYSTWSLNFRLMDSPSCVPVKIWMTTTKMCIIISLTKCKSFSRNNKNW